MFGRFSEKIMKKLFGKVAQCKCGITTNEDSFYVGKFDILSEKEGCRKPDTCTPKQRGIYHLLWQCDSVKESVPMLHAQRQTSVSWGARRGIDTRRAPDRK
jgi:hypothetical protein